MNPEIHISNSCILETSNTDELQRGDNDDNHYATGSLYESLGVDSRDETAPPDYTLPDGYLEIEGSDCNVIKEEENACAPERNVTSTKGHSTGEIKSLRTPYHDAKTERKNKCRNQQHKEGCVELDKPSSGLSLTDLKVERRSETDKERENKLPKQNNRTRIQRESDTNEKPLCHFNNQEKLDLNSLRALIGKDKNFPLILACKRKLFGSIYFHFVVVTKYRNGNVHITHVGSFVRRKHRREFLKYGRLIGICNDIYNMSAEGKLPKRTSKFFNFKDGVYLIRDFDPKSDSEKDQICRRIAREVYVNKIHYSVRFYSCEHFAVYAMTGNIPKITQLDNMGRKMRILAYLIDNSIRTMVSLLKIGLQWQIMMRNG